MKPRAVVGSFANLARIKRFPLRTYKWDMLNEDFPPDVLPEGAAVVHLAYTTKYKAEQNLRANLEGTKNLLSACVQGGISHFIYLSSTAIYDEMPDKAVIKEDTKPALQSDSYGYDKILIEDYISNNGSGFRFPITVVRPSIVFGPLAPAWTIRIYSWIKDGVLKRYDTYQGKCNLVYLDNVVNFIYNCVNNPKSYSRKYNVVDDTNITWSDYLEKYENLLGQKIIEGNYLLFSLKYQIRLKILKLLKSIFWINPALFRPYKNKLAEKSPKTMEVITNIGPELATIRLFGNSHFYDIERNFEILPFTAWVNFPRAWQMVEEHFREYSY